jgi:hypothetical protein
MADIQPLLILDVSAILGAQPVAWKNWDRFGQCILAQEVLQEIESLQQQDLNPEEQNRIQEFLRFAANSNYRVTEIQLFVRATHENRRSLSAVVAETAYALAKEQVGTLVVVVSKKKSLIQRILSLGIVNLTAISVVELYHWQNNHHKPLSVEQALKRMGSPAIPAGFPQYSRPIGTPIATDLILDPLPRSKRSRPKRSLQRQPLSPWVVIKRSVDTLLVLISITLLTGSGLVAWRVIDPKKTEVLWQLLKLPDIPELAPSKKPVLNPN